MNFLEQTLIIKGLSSITEFIDDWQQPFLVGLGRVALLLGVFWVLLYFIGYQSFVGHLTRNAIIVGVWIACEFTYWFGGGHRRN